jgi:hypothetical protein
VNLDNMLLSDSGGSALPVSQLNNGSVTVPSAPTPTSTRTPVPGLPGVPALVAPANSALLTNNRPKFDWKDTVNAHHYSLQVATDSTFAIKVLNQTDILVSEFTPPTDLTPNKKYYWHVQACNSGAVCGTWSAARNFRLALPTPINLEASGTTQNLRPLFTWDMPAYPAPAATGFTVQISKNNTFTKIVMTGNPTGLSYTPTANLPKSTPLYWRVRTKGANGPSAWSDAGSYTTGNPPASPALLAPPKNVLLFTYTPSLTWSVPAFPTGTTFKSYRVQVATDAAFTTVVRDAVTVNLATPVWPVDPALNQNTRFYWHAQACNTDDECSAWSAARYFRTALPVPINRNADASVQNLRPKFTWDMPAYPAPSATGFTVQVSRNFDFTQIVMTGNPTGLSYTPTANLPKSTHLFWRVRAKGVNGPGSWSAPDTFTTGNPPASPALLKPANNATGQAYAPTLDWNQPVFPPGTTFKYYRVQLATDAAFTTVIRNQTIKVQADHLWVVDPALTPLTKYYWHVQACNTSDECSAWSTTRNFKTKP